MAETNESNGEKTEKRPSVEEIRTAIRGLPQGTKERVAWEELGEGNISREAFRDLWLEIRVPGTRPWGVNEPGDYGPSVNNKPKDGKK